MKPQVLRKAVELNRQIQINEERTEKIERLQSSPETKIYAIYKNGEERIQCEITHLDMVQTLEVEVQHNHYLLAGLRQELAEL